MSTGRNTAIRDEHRRTIRKTGAACGICGDAIDYDLPSTDPMSFVVDHIIPRVHGGGEELTNKQAAHKYCNGSKGARPDQVPLRRSRSIVWPST